MLAKFLDRTRGEAFAWGRNDCALWCASAVKFATGYDPASDLRGTYDSKFTCYQIVKCAGGLVNLVAPRMEHPDLMPISGDGVAISMVHGRSICGLVVDGRFIMRAPLGLEIVDQFRIVRGWTWLQR